VSQTNRVVAPDAHSSVNETVCSAANGTEADLGWALSIVIRAFRITAGASVAELPGGLRGYLVLTVVAQGQPSSQLALAQQLAVDKTAMTYLLDELEGAGLVTRRPDPADRRARQVGITPKGSTLLEEFARRLTDAEAKVLSPLNAAERTTLRELLGRVANSAQSVDEPCLEGDSQPC
jgi:DNA-binding MarR family transcriptional regulator